MPRIPYPDEATLGDTARKILAGSPLNVVRIGAHASPALFEAQGRLSYAIADPDVIDPRIREAAILRVAQLSNSTYELHHHHPMARAAGLTEGEIAAILSADYAALDGKLSAVCRFADEVVTVLSPSDETMAALRAEIPDRDVVNLILTIGCYMSIARLIAATGIELDEVAIEHLASGIEDEGALMVSTLTLHNVKTMRFGAGVAAECAGDLAALGCRRVLIVTGAPIRALCLGLETSLAEAGCAAILHEARDGEPTLEDLATAIAAARDFKADAVVGFGGGSAMDVAKLVAALADGKQDISDVVGIGLLAGRALPLACIPTTAGTGSEATPIAIVEDSEALLKKGVVSPHLVPDFAYLDPELTRTMPRNVTAATGIDALTHCIEAYANRFAHPVVDQWALEGISLIARHIERACADGDDMEARAAMLRASNLGGQCLGPVNTAAVHALAYPLGGEFHIAHGVANSLLLPHVLRFNLEAAPGRYAEIAGAMGVRRSGNDHADALNGIEEIERLSAAIGIERRLSAFGISANTIPHMAAAAMTVQRLLVRNPREVTEDDARAIYAAAL